MAEASDRGGPERASPPPDAPPHGAASARPLLAAACGPAVAAWDYGACAAGPGLDPSSSEVDPLLPSPSPASRPAGPVLVHHPHGTVPPPREGGEEAATTPATMFPIIGDLALHPGGRVVATCLRGGGNSSYTSYGENDDAGEDDDGGREEPHGTVALTDAATGGGLETLECGPGIASVEFGGRGRYLAVASTGEREGKVGGGASVWDLRKRARVRTFRLPGGGGGCSAAGIDPTDTYLAAASAGGAAGGDGGGGGGAGSGGRPLVGLYRLREGRVAATLWEGEEKEDRPGRREGGGVSRNALAFSRMDPGRIAVGTRDGSVVVWDAAVPLEEARVAVAAAPPPPIRILPSARMAWAHGGAAVTGVAFSPRHKGLLASAAEDGTVAFHDVDLGRTVQTLRPPPREGEGEVGNEQGGCRGVRCLAFAADGITFAVGTGDGRALVYDLRTAAAGPVACLRFVPGDGRAAFPVTCVEFSGRAAAAAAVAGTAPAAQTFGAGAAAGPALAAQASGAGAAPKKAEPPAPPPRPPPAPVTAGPGPADAAAPAPSGGGATPTAPAPADAKGEGMVAAGGPGEGAVWKGAAAPVAGGKDGDGDGDVGQQRQLPQADAAAGADEGRSRLDPSPLSAEALASAMHLAASVAGRVPAPGPPLPAPMPDQRREGGTDITMSKSLLRRVVQDAVDDLREDMENSIKAMHIDMIRSFQRQSDEMRDVFAQQNQTISILEAVNMDLRRQLGEQRRFFSSEEY